jgi:hypothetical protein
VAFKEEVSSGDKNIVFFLDLEPNPETPVCSLDRGFREGPVAACTAPDNNNNSESRKRSIGWYWLAVRSRYDFKSAGYGEKLSKR